VWRDRDPTSQRIFEARKTSTIESGWHRNSQVISDIINNVGGGKEIGENASEGKGKKI